MASSRAGGSLIIRMAGLCCVAAVTVAATPGMARSTRDEMMLLEPSERIEQVCNTKAMGEVQRSKGLHPDEMVAYAYRDPQVKGWRIKAPGAAVRSGSTWYHLAYDCETEHDGLDVKSFTFTLGAAIPTSEWGAHYLVAP